MFVTGLILGNSWAVFAEIFQKKVIPRLKLSMEYFSSKDLSFFILLTTENLVLQYGLQTIQEYDILLTFYIHVFLHADGTSGKCSVTAPTETNSSSTFDLAEHA